MWEEKAGKYNSLTFTHSKWFWWSCQTCLWCSYTTTRQETSPKKKSQLQETVNLTSNKQNSAGNINHEGNVLSLFITTFETRLRLHLPHPISPDEMSIRSQARHMAGQAVPKALRDKSKALAGPACKVWHSIFIFKPGGARTFEVNIVFDLQSSSMMVICVFILVYSLLKSWDRTGQMSRCFTATAM